MFMAQWLTLFECHLIQLKNYIKLKSVIVMVIIRFMLF